MKKLLGILTTIAITTAPLVAVVSCGQDPVQESKADLTFNVVNDSKDIDDAVVDVIEKHLNDYVDEFAEGLALKDIHIFDNSTSPFKGDEGDYIPETNELVVNTFRLGQYTNFDDSDKANYIMQLLGHEYNHFVDHSYLMNVVPGAPETDESIYTGAETRIVQPWSKEFLTQFKHILHYDIDTPKYQDTVIDTSGGRDIKSIGSIYNAKDIFDQSNGQKNPDDLFTKLDEDPNVYYVAAPINPTVYIDPSREIKKSTLSYPYSMDELFARKMQLATSVYHRSTHFKANGFYSYKKQGQTHTTEWESPYLEDVVKYQRGFDGPNNDGTNNSGTNNDGQYLYDKPTQSLTDLYEDAKGVGKPISFLEFKNDKHIQSDGSITGSIDKDKIRFGGSIDSDGALLSYKLLESQAEVDIPIHISTDPEGNKFYLTDFINPKSIAMNKLYIHENGVDTLITSTRDTKYGDVSTRRAGDLDSDVNYAFNAYGILQTL